MTTHDNAKIVCAAKEAADSFNEYDGFFERFYAIAFEAGRQAERAECAKVCEALGVDYKGRFGEDESLFLASSECADAIRARSTK